MADRHTLQEIGLTWGIIEHHAALKNKLNPAQLVEDVHRLGAWVLTLDDEEYPSLLRELDDAPPVLYGKGELTAADQRAIAMIGTRKASGLWQTSYQTIGQRSCAAGYNDCERLGVWY